MGECDGKKVEAVNFGETKIYATDLITRVNCPPHLMEDFKLHKPVVISHHSFSDALIKLQKDISTKIGGEPKAVCKHEMNVCGDDEMEVLYPNAYVRAGCPPRYGPYLVIYSFTKTVVDNVARELGLPTLEKIVTKP